MADLDVLIAGAGPAGCATAIMLAEIAPELRVCLIDAGPPLPPRIGETAPPALRPALQQLGVWGAFVADDHCPSYRTLSAWGNGCLASNEFLFQTEQVGWRLDRDRFDATLNAAAADHVANCVAARVAGLANDDGEWQVGLDDGGTCSARFVVDATGRSAALGRFLGLPSASLDRLVACFMHLESARDDIDGLLIETFSDGWWYTAAIPGGRRVIACMTDASEVRSLGLHETDGLMESLSGTQYVRLFAKDARLLGLQRVAPANSRRHQRWDSELPILAVGDAASCFDPVCGQGIVKALRSGIFASYAIVDWLRRAETGGVKRYWRLLDREFSSYARTLSTYYWQEQRWPERPFWRRRHHPENTPSYSPAHAETRSSSSLR